VQIKKLASRIGKGVLAGNLAAVLRLAMHGASSLDYRLSRAYQIIDPFDALNTEGSYESIPEIHLCDLVRRLVSVNLGEGQEFVDGSMPWVDLFPLMALVHDRQPKCIFEIGTYFGYTTRALALNFPETTIHTLDLPESYDPAADNGGVPKDDFHLIAQRRVGHAFRNDPSVRNVIQHFGDSATWDFAPVKDADLFFIDGSHTYEYIRNDTEKCLALCGNRRATILWHDCDRGHPGVVRYLAELVQAQFPVKRVSWTHLAILEI
jgi:hypothetical protein